MRLVVEVGSARAGGGSPEGAGAQAPGPGAEFRIEQAAATIGRGPECDVVLGEPAASRQHARVQMSAQAQPGGGDSRSSGTWYLTDLGTTNGTFLNGRRLQAHQPERLTPGDRVSIGNSVLVVRDLEAPPVTRQETGGLMGLHPAIRAGAALLFVLALALAVALLVIVLQPEPPPEQAVAPTAASPLDVLTTVMPTGVPEELLEPLEQMLTSQPGLPLLPTREP